MLRSLIAITAATLPCLAAGVWAAGPETDTPTVTVDWSKTIGTSKSIATLQVVVNPPLRRGSAIHDNVFKHLRDLNADMVRYVPWLPYPKLAVAALEPPTQDKTSWDFSLIDPLTIDFLEATKGHATVLNFSTIPAWMFKTDKPVTYPANPDEPIWNYTQGTELRDPSCRELADYYARLVSWYAKGGFTDELGQRHESGHHYPIAWWEVFNEPDEEHKTTPQDYTKRYDAVVSAVRAVSPETKFVGLSMLDAKKMEYYEYFLNAAHHQPGIPLDAVSFHFYARPPNGPATRDPAAWHFCEQADGFLKTARAVDAIRQRLSPKTQLHINELGVIADDDAAWRDQPIYWNAAAAMYAYVYAELCKDGIEVIGASQLVGYPTQYPSVSMVNWTTGQPNARFRVLELLKTNFGPGDELIATTTKNANVAAQAYRTKNGRRLLLINKQHTPSEVALPPDTRGAMLHVVDEQTGEGPARRVTVDSQKLTLAPFAVAVLSLPAR